jgi:hypothetical protein
MTGLRRAQARRECRPVALSVRVKACWISPYLGLNPEAWLILQNALGSARDTDNLPCLRNYPNDA